MGKERLLKGLLKGRAREEREGEGKGGGGGERHLGKQYKKVIEKVVEGKGRERKGM